MTCLRCLVFGHDFKRRDFGHGGASTTAFAVATALLAVELPKNANSRDTDE